MISALLQIDFQCFLFNDQFIYPFFDFQVFQLLVHVPDPCRVQQQGIFFLSLISILIKMKAVEHIYFILQSRYDMIGQVNFEVSCTEIMHDGIAILCGFQELICCPVIIKRCEKSIVICRKGGIFRILPVQVHKMLIIGSCHIFTECFSGTSQTGIGIEQMSFGYIRTLFHLFCFCIFFLHVKILKGVFGLVCRIK